ncbi:hypothetical protein [Tolypothrix sp. VBCCA 56010]|uniref:hypothetical protein n=1 Tax=Tolypothrix sp. VBCCA 56010 TaxID=3137731 RepID=UPI003D7DA4C9
MSNTGQQSKHLLRPEPMVEWKDTNLRKLERVVFKLQKRISVNRKVFLNGDREAQSTYNQVVKSHLIIIKIYITEKGFPKLNYKRCNSQRITVDFIKTISPHRFSKHTGVVLTVLK